MSERRDKTSAELAAAHRSEYPEEGFTQPKDREVVGRPDADLTKEPRVYEDPTRE